MPKYKRVLIKLTGEALSGENNSGLQEKPLEETAQQIIDISKKGIQVAIVVGGGNILRGASLSTSPNYSRVGADQMGMLATIINALAIKETIQSLGHKSEVLTSIEMLKVCDVFNKNKANQLLEEGNILVLGGGTGNPFFTTDSTAALRALEINADIILKATKVDGIYDKDPNEHKDAVKYDTLTFDQAIKENLKIMDQTAFTLCKENNKEIIVFDFLNKGQLSKLISGEKIGTRIHS
ncbi:MAG: UMP kinase [Planctomycetota bacterium]|nr:MAG: UMP kinase [Planctomycetota bacterium]